MEDTLCWLSLCPHLSTPNCNDISLHFWIQIAATNSPQFHFTIWQLCYPCYLYLTGRSISSAANLHVCISFVRWSVSAVKKGGISFHLWYPSTSLAHAEWDSEIFRRAMNLKRQWYERPTMDLEVIHWFSGANRNIFRHILTHSDILSKTHSNNTQELLPRERRKSCSSIQKINPMGICICIFYLYWDEVDIVVFCGPKEKLLCHKIEAMPHLSEHLATHLAGSLDCWSWFWTGLI